MRFQVETKRSAFSFAPGFSPVVGEPGGQSRFNGFSQWPKAAKAAGWQNPSGPPG